MAPKAKKSSAGKSKAGSGGIVDSASTTEMTREQLEQHSNRLRKEIEREREERHFFQLERDKLRTFWEITRQQLEECRAEVRNKDRELEEKEEQHQHQDKIMRQKLKHLLYEHQTNIFDLRAEHLISLKMAQEDFGEQEGALLEDKKNLKEILLEQRRDHEEAVKTLKMEFAEKLSEARKEMEDQRTELESRYETLLETQRNELILSHRVEMTEINERKNKQISDLMKNHEKAFADMKTYYNDITLNNLALISSLKEQIKEAKQKEERMRKTLREINKENRDLTEPLKKAKEEASELKRQLTFYAKDKSSLANVKKAMAAAQKELESARWENQVLEMKLETSENEIKDLQAKLAAAVLEIQQKSTLRNVLLEKKMKSLVEIMQQREKRFAEILLSCRIDPATLPFLSDKMEAPEPEKLTAG